MSEVRMKKLAEVLVNYSVKVKPGDWMYINSSIVAMPLMKEVYREVLKAGGNPTTIIYDDDLNEIYYKEANEDQPSTEGHIIEGRTHRVWIASGIKDGGGQVIGNDILQGRQWFVAIVDAGDRWVHMATEGQALLADIHDNNLCTC